MNLSVFTNGYFSEVDISNSRLIRTNLFETTLNLSNLINVDFSKANLTFANFCRSNLKNAKFYQANIEEVEFAKANLENTDFRGVVNLEDCESLTEAYLKKIIISSKEKEFFKDSFSEGKEYIIKN
jgi:uncharacterized protein YjbI with pentapeptide repeats